MLMSTLFVLRVGGDCFSAGLNHSRMEHCIANDAYSVHAKIRNSETLQPKRKNQWILASSVL